MDDHPLQRAVFPSSIQTRWQNVGLALGKVVREGDSGTETGGIDGRGGRNKSTPAGSSCVGVQCPSCWARGELAPLTYDPWGKVRRANHQALSASKHTAHLLVGTVLVHLDGARADEDISAVGEEGE